MLILRGVGLSCLFRWAIVKLNSLVYFILKLPTAKKKVHFVFLESCDLDTSSVLLTRCTFTQLNFETLILSGFCLSIIVGQSSLSGGIFRV